MRWSIVGRGAKSLQTQDIFHGLVKDTLVQDDPVKNISNMRTAIENTNVVLNLVICPGIILIPSSMIILKRKVAGYNNVLTLATKDMKFGVNENVNKIIQKSKTEQLSSPDSQAGNEKEKGVTPPVIPKSDIPINEKNYNADVLPTLGSTIVFGFLIAKYII